MSKKLFDFNVHSVSSQLLPGDITETSITLEDLANNLDKYYPYWSAVDFVNLMILNDTLFLSDNSVEKLKSILLQYPKIVSVTATTPLSVHYEHRYSAFNYLEILKEAGVKGIKFHSYTQGISEADYSNAVLIAQRAASMGFYICIDTSYGTTKLFDYNNMKLAARICEFVKDTPVILLHSGGMRFNDALVIADYCSNVYLETSFSLNYLANSPYEDFFAFLYRKIGSERVIFASDFPYVLIEQAIEVLDRVLEKAGFSEAEKENVFYKNAVKIVNLAT